MAMHYQLSSEIQADGFRTLYLMNPNFVGYSTDANSQSQSNTCFFNPASVHALTSSLAPHAPLPHDPSRPSEEIRAAPRLHYNNPWCFADSSNSNQPNTPQPQRCLSLNFPYDHQQEYPGKSKDRMAPSRNPTAAMENVIIGSKYVKVARELLDEVASVIGRGTKDDLRGKGKTNKEAISLKSEDVPTRGGDKDSNKRGGSELTTAQRQEILMKKAKLSSMLDEVDQKCKQYHHQMQIVVSSFEKFAGIGSARSYTQVAIRTILRQFRCLKATILGQIKGLNKSLGEEEKEEERSRLRLVDHRLGQHMGMMMSSTAWRPQRGLPERAVAVLRAWLFEHFLHPYPKDSDKQMLAKRTGLTRSQVSNWFINARVRLWKPMVEEMYLEEIKSQEYTPRQQATEVINLHSDPHRDAPSKNTNLSDKMKPTGPSDLQYRPQFARPITSLGPENLPKKPHQGAPPAPVEIHGKPAGSGIPNLGFGGYEICQLDSAGPSLGGMGFQKNVFSLSLGLPPLDTSAGPRRQGFMSTRNFNVETRMDTEIDQVHGINHANSYPAIGYEILNFQDRKTFQAPAQVLPDFVA